MSNQPTEKAAVLVDVYGRNPPAASQFGKGVTDQAGVREATTARENAKPGEFSLVRTPLSVFAPFGWCRSFGFARR